MKNLFIQPRQKIYNFSFFEPIKILISKKINDENFRLFFAKNFNLKNSIAVSQGRIGIYLAVKAIISDNKNEIILSPYTVFDVVNMVICAGGKPIFADIDFPNLSISTNEVRNKININTAGVILTHYHSYSQNFDEIASLLKQHDIKLIEDCAQVFGTSGKDFLIGSKSDISIFSFNITKFISTLSGGLLVCSDENIYRKIKYFSKEFNVNPFFYLVSKYLRACQVKIFTSDIIFNFFTRWVIKYTLNSKLKIFKNLVRSDPNPILTKKLPKFYKSYVTNYQRNDIYLKINKYLKHNKQEIRLANYLYYQNSLENINEIVTHKIKHDNLNGAVSFPIFYNDRDNLYKYMILNGCDVSKYFYRDCSSLGIFSDFASSCRNAKRACDEVLLLPVYPNYTKKSMEKNIKVIKDFFKNRLNK